MTFIIDIVLVAIFIFTVFNGYRKGFIKTLFGLIGVILALLIASTVSENIGVFINDNFAEMAIEDVINTNLSESLDNGDAEQVIEKITEYAPSEEIGDDLVVTFKQKGSESIDLISKELAHKISLPMCKAVAFFAMFVIIYFVVLISAFCLDKVFRLPVLKTANSVLGLIIGILCAIVITMVVARTWENVLPWLSGKYPTVLYPDIIEDTFVLKFFCKYNLFSTLVVGVAGLLS